MLVMLGGFLDKSASSPEGFSWKILCQKMLLKWEYSTGTFKLPFSTTQDWNYKQMHILWYLHNYYLMPSFLRMSESSPF